MWAPSVCGRAWPTAICRSWQRMIRRGHSFGEFQYIYYVLLKKWTLMSIQNCAQKKLSHHGVVLFDAIFASFPVMFQLQIPNNPKEFPRFAINQWNILHIGSIFFPVKPCDHLPKIVDRSFVPVVDTN